MAQADVDGLSDGSFEICLSGSVSARADGRRFPRAIATEQAFDENAQFDSDTLSTEACQKHGTGARVD
jgi:hypothetical protein